MGIWNSVIEVYNRASSIISGNFTSGATAGIIGQYYFHFDIDGVGDFLAGGGEIHQFVMEESIGKSIPMFDLTFSTLDSSIVNRLNEGTNILCIFGKSTTEWKSAEMMIQKFSHKPYNTDYMLVNIKGILAKSTEFIADQKQKAFRDKTSVEVIKDTVADYFLVEDQTVLTPDDKHTWLRTNQSPMDFIYKTWERSHIDDSSLLLTALGFDGKYIITDTVAVAQSAPKWKLSLTETGPNVAQYQTDIQMTSKHGLLNHLAAYKTHQPDYSVIDGTMNTVVTPARKAFLTSGAPNITSAEPNRINLQTLIDSDNVHKNYSKAKLHNNAKLALMNSIELNIVIENKWQDYKLFDLIDYEPSRPKENQFFSAEADTLGGLYTITKISRFFGGNRCATKITIARDGINKNIGAGLEAWGI